MKANSNKDGQVSPIPTPTMAWARQAGKAEAYKFIALVERSQRVRVQKLLWEVTDENRALGGKKWKKVLKHFGLAESDIYKTKP